MTATRRGGILNCLGFNTWAEVTDHSGIMGTRLLIRISMELPLLSQSLGCV